jgi:hypothetical protein
VLFCDRGHSGNRPSAYGEPASANPALHLRRLDGGQIAGHYLVCFERVWDTAKPWYGEEV